VKTAKGIRGASAGKNRPGTTTGAAKQSTGEDNRGAQKPIEREQGSKKKDAKALKFQKGLPQRLDARGRDQEKNKLNL